MLHDGSRKARELIQRGLEHYARGRLREAVLVWQEAAALAPEDPRARSLLAFVRARVRERDTRPAAHAARDTLESPIPGFLASLTLVEADERASDPADGEWGRVDTRRVLAGTSELAAHEGGQDARDAADTWKELPIQNDDMGTLKGFAPPFGTPPATPSPLASLGLAKPSRDGAPSAKPAGSPRDCKAVVAVGFPSRNQGLSMSALTAHRVGHQESLSRANGARAPHSNTSNSSAPFQGGTHATRVRDAT